MDDKCTFSPGRPHEDDPQRISGTADGLLLELPTQTAPLLSYGTRAAPSPGSRAGERASIPFLAVVMTITPDFALGRSSGDAVLATINVRACNREDRAARSGVTCR